MLTKAGLPITDENVFIAASCKEKGILYLTGKAKVNGVRKVSEMKKDEKPASPSASTKSTIKSPVDGKVVKVFATAGSNVSSGAKLLNVDSNGKEYAISSPRGGKLVSLSVKEGDSVAKMGNIAEIE